MIGLQHYGHTEGLLEQEPDEIARAIEAYEHTQYLQQQAARRRKK
jgi:hypothetical protein